MIDISIILDLIPSKTTFQANSKIVKIGSHYSFMMPKKSKGSLWKNELISSLNKFAPERPIESPVSLLVIHQFPFLKKDATKSKEARYLPCSTRPDCDNLNKIFQDCLVASLFLKDDSIVCDLRIIKQYSHNPCLFFQIKDFRPFDIQKKEIV